MKFATRLKPSTNLIDLTPLVDVIFLLLIFFIVTSDILPLKSLHIENPTLQKDSEPLTSQVLVVMDAENVIYVGSKKAIVDLTSLKGHIEGELKKIKSLHQNADPTVVLSVDGRVEYGIFLKLFSIVQETSSKLRLVYRPIDESEEGKG